MNLTEDSINFINNNSLSLIQDLKNIISVLENNIIIIDESNYLFRSNIENWTFYMKNGIQRNNRYIPNVNRIARHSILEQKDDGMKEFFLNKRSSSKNTVTSNFKELKADMSKHNSLNLQLSLIHILLYMFNFAIIIPSCFLYIETVTKHHDYGILSGCILSISPLLYLYILTPSFIFYAIFMYIR